MKKIYWLLLMAMLVATAACGGTAEPTATTTETTETTATTETADKPTIQLIENPWPAAELNARVAKVIIENELGYPVEVIALDENLQWDALAGGNADASLEVWPSGHGERIAQYIDDQKVVNNGGPLGPQGIIGWYVPTYVVNDHPELATWEGYADPELSKLFATAETGDKGQFLAGDPSWVQYDADIIANLGLNLTVVTAGSEDALLAAVSSAYARQEPILFYFYEPHAIFSQFELTRVELPAYSDECYATADSGGVACSYPTDALMKILSPALQTKAPDVYSLLQKMSYDNDAQITMLGMVNDGMSIDAAAAKWVEDNAAVWQAWLP
jgi:glycine betaine/proline transport system substrate-binding protein